MSERPSREEYARAVDQYVDGSIEACVSLYAPELKQGSMFLNEIELRLALRRFAEAYRIPIAHTCISKGGPISDQLLIRCAEEHDFWALLFAEAKMYEASL